MMNSSVEVETESPHAADDYPTALDFVRDEGMNRTQALVIELALKAFSASAEMRYDEQQPDPEVKG